MKITYRDLLHHLSALSEEQLDKTVTVYDYEQDEFKPVQSYDITDNDCDVLDDKHPVLTIGLPD